jgi:hypothetical protein
LINSFFKVITSCLLILTLIFNPLLIYAADSDSEVAYIESGQPAPFDGVLLPSEVAAALIIRLETADSVCSNKIEYESKKITIEFNARLSVCNLKLHEEQKRYNAILSAKQERINFLEKNYKEKQWYESEKLWFTVGLASGFVLAVALVNYNNNSNK